MAFTVVDYIMTRLREQHVDTLFGVPAATCAELFDKASSHGVDPVVTASDLEAGYAADGYARAKGLAAVAVGYGVGTLSMINAIAGAHVERSPVIVLNGGPTVENLNNLKNFDVLFSHSTGRPDTDLNAYELITESAVRVDRAADVPAAVDRAITTAIKRKRPVYVEISKSVWNQGCPMPTGRLSPTNPPAGTEKELATKIVGLIRAANKPLILVGTEIQRYGLADKVADLISKLGVRWSSTLLAKSTLAEKGKGWVGVYHPPHSTPVAKEAVEQADLLVMLGCVFPNGYARLVTGNNGRIVSAYDGKVKIKGGPKQNAEIGALVTELVAAAATAPPGSAPAGVIPAPPPPATGALTYRQVFQRVGAALDDSWIVVPDTFLGDFAAADLPVKGRDAFICGAVWASIGHSVAAAVGISFGSGRRPLVICGDGGFQMTAQALSTMARYGRDPVVVLIDNGIYAYEQFLIDPAYFSNAGAQPKPYVVLNHWDFTKLANSLGVRSATSVDTARAFDDALAAAKTSNAPALIVAKVNPHDLPIELS
ncbi:thiamine pyrophosphate-dependent enzyme [Actinomadura syzygii]|uniref:Alpha-keto-acid decarboxylase n=1 Tax=Actinomadura syzygii TaxID=1427538 RepID=A0A5D0U9I8_9ACTN|nr:thiamine pyrophosphate-dependent enzyme [Actinomadura syzygii]TYC14353.1 alpha-keto acid decarboxylase family protein [Actinomadura syzygii]